MPQIQLKRGTRAQWVSNNPILAQGEQVFELDTNRTKIGDGVHHYLELEYTTLTPNMLMAMVIALG